MVVDVIGWRNVSFDDASGRHIEGYSAYYLNNIAGGYGIGKQGEKQFVNASVVGSTKIELGKYDFEFGPKGRLVSIKKL